MGASWIEDYTDFLVEQTGTNVDWAESIATSILSTVLGSRRYLYTKQGAVKMNLFFLYIGPSGLSKKSLPMTNFGQPLIEKYDELMGYSALTPPKRTELPRRFSLEGMISYLNEENQEGLLWKDEFTSMFKEANKEYMSGLIEFVSELVDGKLGARYTNKNKLQLPQDVYVNVIAATTPYIYDVISNDFFLQGTGNRVLYLIYDGKYKAQDIVDTEKYFGSYNKELHDSDQDEYAKNLTLLGNSQLNYLQPIDEAGQMWLKWRNELDERVLSKYKENMFDIQTVYLGKVAINTLKLAGIHRYSRLCRDPIQQSLLTTEPTELIMAEDMEWAIKKTQKHLNHFDKLVHQWHTRPDKYAKETESQTLLNLLQKSVDGLAFWQIRRTCKWNDRTLREVFKTLFEQRMIKLYSKKSGGRPTLRVVDHENILYDTRKEWHEITSWSSIKVVCGW